MGLTGIALAGITGCASTLALDSGRALPKGQVEVVAAVGVGPTQPRHRFDSAAAEHGFGEAEKELPTTNPDVEPTVRFRFGVGNGLQLELGILGLGLIAGVKAQVVGDHESMVAFGLASRLGISGFGSGTDDSVAGSLGLFVAVLELPFSVHLPSADPNGHTIAIVPRLHYGLAFQSHTVEHDTLCTSDGAISVGGSLIYAYRFSNGLGVLAEVSPMYTPHLDSVGATFGLGFLARL